MFKQSTDRLAKDGENNMKVLRQMKRRRRTNILLVLLSLVFFLSWLPLNIFSVILKFTDFDMVIWLVKKSHGFLTADEPF